MSKNQWKAFALSLLAIIMVVITIAVSSTRSIYAQSTISEVRDVSPTDFYFESLQNLIERYGVPVTYPDKTFRGNRAITRGEQAIWLNSALDTISSMTGSNADNNSSVIELERKIQALEQKLNSLESTDDDFKNIQL